MAARGLWLLLASVGVSEEELSGMGLWSFPRDGFAGEEPSLPWGISVLGASCAG